MTGKRPTEVGTTNKDAKRKLHIKRLQNKIKEALGIEC